MKNSRFTHDHGAEIFVLRFCSNITSEMMEVIDECARQVQQRPPKSVKTMTIVDGAKFSTPLIEGLKHLTKGNEPYMRRAAAVGVTGLYKAAIKAISLFSKREFKLFDTEQVAAAYLMAE